MKLKGKADKGKFKKGKLNMKGKGKFKKKGQGGQVNKQGKRKGQGGPVNKQGKRKGQGGPPNKNGKEIGDMTVDEMFSMIQDDSDFDDSKSAAKAEKKSKKTFKKKKNVKSAEESIDDVQLDGLADDDDDSFEEDEELANASSMSRKDYLEKLKKSDPEFYATMMKSSELMDLRSSDEEDKDESDDDKESSEGEKSEAEEEEESEESDVEMNDSKILGGNITPQMITQWEEGLKSKKPLTAFFETQQALLAAIESISGGTKESNEKKSKYTVKGSQSFNAIIRLCLRNMAHALRTLFQIKDSNQIPSKSKKWSKYRNYIKLYLRQMIALTEVVAEPAVAEVVLRNGILPLVPFYAGYHNMSKLLTRRLIAIWATSDKKVRVMAFMAIFRLSQLLHGEFLEWMLKKMYIAYVQNCRFTSPSTWGLIDFMRVSLVELYSLDVARAYRHAFVYIRQMAIHLRNAILLPKKERVQLVYNWQYIHCLNLWSDLLGKTHPNSTLQPMIFPVTQVAIGAMKLQPTQTFFPLAFHIFRILTELSRSTGTFIPVMPLLLEILNKAIFFKQPQKASIRPFNWMCMLRLSRAELKESAFKDGVVDQVYDGMVNYLSVVSTSIAFPDFVVPAVLQLKTFVKKCRSPNYCKKFRQLLDKIRENSEFIEDRRKDVKFGIADSKAVKDWEISVKQSGTPLSKYYESWRKIREKEHQQQFAESISVSDHDLPSMKKRQLEKLNGNDRSELDMFASDEEESDDDLPVEAGIEDDKASNIKEDDDEEEDEDDDEEDDGDEEEDNDDECSGPQPKKAKMEEELKDLKASHNDVVDVVREFNFSDLDDDDDGGPDDDDYGVGSDIED